MFKGKIPNILYLFHILIILVLWIVFFYLFFLKDINLKFNFPKTYFYLFETIGFIFFATGFFILRKSSLTDDEKKMFKLTKIGDIILILGFLISFLTSLFYGKIELSLGITLGTLIILQTHFPLIEDDSLYPEELMNEDFK